MSSLEDRLKLLEPAPASDALRARIAHPTRSRSRVFRYVPLAAAAAGLIAVFIFAVTEAPHGRTTSTTQAEADLKKIEETLMAAKTLQVEIQREAHLKAIPPVRETNVETKILLSLKEGNRMKARLWEKPLGTPNPPPSEFLHVSDGKRKKVIILVKEISKTVVPEADTPPDLNRRFVMALARESAATPGNLMAMDLTHDVSDVRQEPSEEGFAVVSYKVGPFDAKLRYDRKTFLPVQRTLTNEKIGSFVESYRFEVNVRIDDAEFTLPPEK